MLPVTRATFKFLFLAIFTNQGFIVLPFIYIVFTTMFYLSIEWNQRKLTNKTTWMQRLEINGPCRSHSRKNYLTFPEIHKIYVT